MPKAPPLPSAALARAIPFFVFGSGLAALSWEVIWQLEAALALGISAWGASIILAAAMGGMSLGSLWMSGVLRRQTPEQPLHLYGGLEIIIGLAGLCLLPAFHALAAIDARLYAAFPGETPLVYLAGIVAILGVPTFCMGATLPVLGLIARQHNFSLARLYGLNTLGAAAGALIVALLFIPRLGVTHSCWAVAALNIAIGLIACATRSPPLQPVAAPAALATATAAFTPRQAALLALATGFATFMLEIAWFRALKTAFLSTTDAFAIMVAVVLLALGAAAWLTPLFRRRNVALGTLVVTAAALILLATPIVERLYWITPAYNDPLFVILDRLIKSFIIIGIPVIFLGMALPWLLEEQTTPRQWGRLYALNTCAAIAGAVAAAWIFLPTLGIARTAWLAGVLVLAAGLSILPRQRRLPAAALGCAALLIAVMTESGIGRTHSAGRIAYDSGQPARLLQFFEGPESSVAAVEYNNGNRALIVDGFVTAGQTLSTETASSISYMAWMGSLPMLLHPDPQNALVICFGTGQTANAVRRQNAASVDIVDINPRVFKLAHNFDKNEQVLEDPRVHPIVMDGRVYMRRTTRLYDIITLEPMPPNFAGVNALYSREFYELAANRLTPDGILAQWVPFHVAEPAYMAAIAKTFQHVFSNTILWIDPTSRTGILLGSKNPGRDLRAAWPGFARATAKLTMPESEIMAAIWLGPAAMRRYTADAPVITDDNQLLAYGKAVNGTYQTRDYESETMQRLEKLRHD